MKSSCSSESSKDLFAYMFTRRPEWNLYSALSDNDHVLWFGASASSYPIDITVDILDSSLSSVSTAVILPARYLPTVSITGTKQVKATIK